ncbi:hypothetical protein [Priestia aryabhattai]
MVISFLEERRRIAVKEMAIKYIKTKQLANESYEKYVEGRWRGLKYQFYSEYYYKYIEYEDECLGLDISLGLIVKDGDYETIPEYRQAILIE